LAAVNVAEFASYFDAAPEFVYLSSFCDLKLIIAGRAKIKSVSTLVSLVKIVAEIECIT